jgi:hypothetical protein
MMKFPVPVAVVLCFLSANVFSGTTVPVQETLQYESAAPYDNLILALPEGQQPILLVAADMEASSMDASTSMMANDKPIFHERMFTANKVHKYLGIGSIAMAVLAAISPKEEDGAHEYLARGAAALGGAAMATGFAFHHEDIELKNGFGDPDNLHALLTSFGTMGYLLAVSNAPDAHAGFGIGGLLSMGVGIKLTW